MNYPELRQADVQDAKLYADRSVMVKDLIQPGGIVAEVGVAAGYFTRFLLEALKPKKFVGFDIFTMHQHPIIWGRPQEELFEGKTQLDFYRQKFPGIETEVGLAHETMEKYPDGYFDFIYIDADHSYESVKRDANVAARKLSANGTIFFNDYIMFDHMCMGEYGVVQAANEFIVSRGWKVIGFSFQHKMFCDIAVARIHS